MQCFRLSHAGIVLDDAHASLLIDPGNFTSSDDLAVALAQASPLAGIVITHEHPDHWTPDNIAQVRQLAPECPIFTTPATAAALETSSISDATIVVPGQTATAGPFELEFYGGTHEPLHSSIPPVDNVGVRVNQTFAYGGDSLEAPPFQADVLGIPIGSPWSNVGQIIDFILESRPKRAYVTHDGMLSTAGHALFTMQVRNRLASYGGQLLDAPKISDGTIYPIEL